MGLRATELRERSHDERSARVSGVPNALDPTRISNNPSMLGDQPVDIVLRAAHRSGLLIVSPSKDLNRNRDAVIWVVTADHQDEHESPTNKSSDIEPLMPIMSIDSAMVSQMQADPALHCSESVLVARREAPDR